MIPSPISALDSTLKQARRVLVACDFDGTLCRLAGSPGEVKVAPSMLDVLRLLAESDRARLAVISGRRLDDVQRHLPVEAVFAGNHGLEIRGCGLEFEHDSARRLRPHLAQTCRDLETVLARWRGAWVEDKGLSATVHYRAVNPLEQRALRCAVRRIVVGRNASMGLRAASMALEVHPKVDWTKGAALTHIRQELGPFDLCITIGDDYTDENMFLEDDDQICIRVGSLRPTRASFYLSEPSAVAVFLQHVWDVLHMTALPGVPRGRVLVAG